MKMKSFAISSNAPSQLLKMTVDQESAMEVAKRSRGTPRIANRLLKRTRDFSQVRFNGMLNKDVVDKALQLMGVDLLGLDESDRRILSAIISKHGGGPVGVETIAATAHEDIGTIEDVFEPFLMQIGFLKKDSAGPGGNQRAYKHLGLPYLMKLLSLVIILSVWLMSALAVSATNGSQLGVHILETEELSEVAELLPDGGFVTVPVRLDQLRK